nr:reverse transcriptase domain-containing protein [Tanacetum cinerariifolium]
MATNGNDDDVPPAGGGDLPVRDLRTMDELCQPTLNGRGDDANKHLDKFLHVTKSMKVNGVSDDALHLYLFPYSLQHRAVEWFDRLPSNSITTFNQMSKIFLEKYFPPSMVTKLRNAITNFCQEPDESLFKAWEHYKLSIDSFPNHNMLPVTQIDTFYNVLTLRHHDTINAAAGGTFMKRRPEACYYLIKNMTAHHNDWDTSAQRSESSSSITSSSDLKIAALKAEMREINRNLMKVLQINQQVKAVTPSSETCGGPHSYNDCPTTVGQTQNENDAILKNIQTNMTTLTNSTNDLKNMLGQFMKMNTASSSSSRTLPSNTITNPKEDLKGITTRSGIAYQGPTIHITSSLPKVVERKTETGRALIDVYEGELTLRVGKEAVTFNLDQTSRYSSNYDDNSVNQIDVIDVACEEYSQEVLGFLVSRNPTPSTKPIVSISSPTLTPFRDSDFLLKETDAFLAIDDEPISPEIDDSYCVSEGDILLLEEVLIDDPSSPPLHLQQLKVVGPKNTKSFIDEPLVVKLKDLPPYLEYAFLEGDDKLHAIISKDLKDEEKNALTKVLKSHKQALAWKLFDIKGINLEFYTHKSLIKDDFKPAVQHQRRVNPKIHELINKEVLKLLYARLIYPISDSPWVSPMHCVPKKGGFTVVKNEENELIPTRLVTG